MKLSETLKALSDESRVRIVHALSLAPLNVQELTELLKLSQPTISHHLKILQSASIVTPQKSGTYNFYTLSSNGNQGKQEIIKTLLSAVKFSTSHESAEEDSFQISNLLKKRSDSSKSFFENLESASWQKIKIEALGSRAFVQEIKSRVPSNLDFADLGCGDGSLLKALLPREGKSIGVDYSSQMLILAKNELEDFERLVDLRLGNLEHLPIADNTLDVVSAHMVLRYCPTPSKAISEINRVLKRGGKVILVDLKRHAREEMRELYKHLWLGFEDSEIKKWLRENNFCDIEFINIDEEGVAFLATGIKS